MTSATHFTPPGTTGGSNAYPSFTDYTYDTNRHLLTVAYKQISEIHDVYLNSPERITVTGKGTICYFQDATG